MLSEVIRSIREYLRLKAEQIKLEVMARTAKIMSHLIVFSMMIFMGLFLVFFLSFAFGTYLNVVFDNPYAGHLSVAGVYLLGLIIIGILAKTGRIQRMFETLIIRMNDQLDMDEEEEEPEDNMNVNKETTDNE